MIELSVSLASNGAVRVPGYEQLVRFGYTKNRAVYRLTVTASGEWAGLTIRAFWHTPTGDPQSSLVVDGTVDVPTSVTAQSGDGCITFEGSDGTRTVTSADLKYRVAENSGTEDGDMPEPGSPAWEQLVGAVREDAAAAEQAKTDAQAAAKQAGVSADKAATSAENAGQSAAEALSWAGAADKSAQAAGLSESNAAQYAGTAKGFSAQATGSAAEAKNSASAAAGSQQAAESSAKKADASAKAAQESATQAGDSASEADNSRQNAETAAGRAEAAQKQTEETRTDALDKIDTAKADALKAVDDKQASATTAVENAQKKALDAVSSAQSTAVKAVSDAQATATQAVQTAQTAATSAVQAAWTAAVGAVEKAGAEVLASIPEDYQTTVQKVEQLETQKAEIDDTTVGPDAWSSKHLIDMLCPPVEETGNPVQCYPVPGYPLGVVASWEPTQEGSGDPSPDNIRPIKGRDSVRVERCGENLLQITPFATVSSNGVTFEYAQDGGVKIQGTASANTDSPTFPVGYLPPGKYYGLDVGTEMIASIVVERDGKCLWLNMKGVFEIISGDIIKCCYVVVCNGITISTTVYPYIVPGTTAPSSYTPYTGQTTTLTFPHTIYGGTVDAVTGEGQETWKLITLDGTEYWRYENDAYFVGHFILNISPMETVGKCSHFIYQYNYGGDNIFCTGDSVYTGPKLTAKYTDVNDWKSYLAAQYAAGTPVQIAYRLVEPVPFTATGAQPIPALSGVNTVLTDADSVTVTGRADPIKRITDLEDAVASMTTT